MRSATVLLLLAAACGGSPSTGPAKPAIGSFAAFVGTWKITDGSATITCDNRSPTPATNVGAMMTLVAGTDSDLAETDAPGCIVKLAVSGDLAAAPAGQTCTSTTVDGGGHLVTQVSTYLTFSLKTDDGKTGSQTLSTTNTVTTGGHMMSCRFDGGGTAVKM